MKFVADLHIHSYFSRATSKKLNLEYLTRWAQIKGVDLVGTGDIAHPGWLEEMKEKLEPAEEGLYRLKREYVQDIQEEVPTACQAPVRFMLAGEISSIYKKNGKVRKIHNVIFAPTLEAVEKIQAALEKIGNIRSDGRPILGLDSRDLLEIILEIDPQNYLIPAHIWTPWFSMLGSKSGFDSVQECFDDLTPHIFALETGLSSDPPMNWRVSDLDRYTLVSNSDAHSPQKLAREANLFDSELSYPALFDVLKSGDPASFLGTIEFFPEEGKYHYDGHRKCGLRWHPQTTLAHDGLCPECGKKVTVGVMHRVETLADRSEGELPTRRHPYQSLIPLPEILAEVHQVGPNTKRVKENYELLLARLGPELSILQDLPLEEIEPVGGALLAEGIRRMRAGEVTIAAGYDGEYGSLELFGEHERDRFAGQLQLFTPPKRKRSPDRTEPQPVSPDQSPSAARLELHETGGEWNQAPLFSRPAAVEADEKRESLAGLNPQQKAAVLCTDLPLIIVAGPGTGKTRTLTHRIAYLIAEKGVSPENILAITFTNKAAEEMAQRLSKLLGPAPLDRLTIKTFHAFGALLLRQAGQDNFSICDEEDRQNLLKQSCPTLAERERQQVLEQISTAKNQLLGPERPALEEQYGLEFINSYRAYETALRQNQLLDFDDLIFRTVELLEQASDLRRRYQTRFRWISVDEYQDINLAQYRLLRLLTGPETNLCVIGDPDQAIYGFRGADRGYFLSFTQDFPEAKRLQLDRNYRSTPFILEASSQVIAKSGQSELLDLWTETVSSTRLELYQAPTDKAEAEYVVHQIERMVGGTSYFSLDSGRVLDEPDSAANRTFADFGVLYRLGAQSQPLIEAFDRSGIPYQTVGQRPLYEYPEIKELLAYLWFVHNPNSALHLRTILGFNRPDDLDRLADFAGAHDLSLAEALDQFQESPFFTTAQVRRLSRVAPFLKDLRTEAQTGPVVDLIRQVYQFISGQKEDEKIARRVHQLILRGAGFENRLPDFLESTLLQKETDFYDPRADRVTLMTLHASKGLEFPVLFIVGCEETLLPYRRPDKPFDLEEERRLFYVGMTRAQQKLILTRAQKRFLFGQQHQNEPSRFLDDIEQILKETKKSLYRKPAKEKPASTQLKLF